VAPPSSTAKRSSEIAPKTIFVRQTYSKPAMSVDQVGRSPLVFCAGLGMNATATPAATKRRKAAP